MQRSVVATIAAAAVCACIQISADAQTTYVKPPPRLTPNLSEQTRIPAGVDTATAATSDSLPLGTPVPPVGSVDRGDQRTRSAAARAAARPAAPRNNNDIPPVSATDFIAADCPTSSEAAFHRAMSTCTNIANRSDRAQCAARAAQDRHDAEATTVDTPVALPGSGFVGSSAGPSAALTATGSTPAGRTPPRLGCV